MLYQYIKILLLYIDIFLKDKVKKYKSVTYQLSFRIKIYVIYIFLVDILRNLKKFLLLLLVNSSFLIYIIYS